MSYATDGAAIVEALKAQGFSGGIFGGDGIGDAGFSAEFTDASAVTGVVATKPRPGEDSTAKSSFESAYEAAGGDPGGIYTHSTYDAVNIIAKAASADSDDDLRDDIKSSGWYCS